jgi:Kef-type K+ transport system membrane component KefB
LKGPEVSEHQLYLFLVDVTVLVIGARLGGELALRLGIAEVVGELVVGVMLGPSLFGALWPEGFEALFPPNPTLYNLLEVMGWIGVIFLVTVSGLEMKLEALRTARKAALAAWAGGFFLPFLLGLGLGYVIPSSLIGSGISRPIFALFVATAMSISAIPVIARMLLDLGLFRTEVGVVIMSSAAADDTVGWIILAAITSLVSAHTVSMTSIATAFGGTVIFLVLAVTLGQRLVRLAIQGSERLRIPYAQTSVILSIILIGGAVTEAIHVHLVLGSFVAAILLAHSPIKNRVSVDSIRHIGMAMFIPFFFSYAGTKVDLTALTGPILPTALGAVAVACIGKLVGGGLGARIGGLSRWEAAAVGVGLNVRGAMELVMAAIGLSIGVLTVPMYSIVILVAGITTLMGAPLLRYCVAREAEVARRVPSSSGIA